ncbi:MAG: NUDIX hydrolase [Anaerolineae bacterium]
MLKLPKRHIARWLQRIPPLRWLLAVLVRVWVPRHYVGAVGVIFNEAGEVLLLEHVFRPYYPWGLPGGWVEGGEDPADTIRREVKEELGLPIKVKQLVLCRVQGSGWSDTTPSGLGLVYYCRLVEGMPSLNLTEVQKGYEILSLTWADPAEMRYQLSPLEEQGITRAKQVFTQEQEDRKRGLWSS